MANSGTSFGEAYRAWRKTGRGIVAGGPVTTAMLVAIAAQTVFIVTVQFFTIRYWNWVWRSYRIGDRLDTFWFVLMHGCRPPRRED